MNVFFEVKDNIITNVIVATKEVAEAMGLVPSIDGKGIGDRYDDTPTVADFINRINFLEDCIAEMAAIVYN